MCPFFLKSLTLFHILRYDFKHWKQKTGNKTCCKKTKVKHRQSVGTDINVLLCGETITYPVKIHIILQRKCGQ